MFAEQLKGLLNIPKLKTKMIMPGEHFVSREGVEITTLLGSCVSACIWDSKRGFGGMNHFLLPEEPNVIREDAFSDPTKSLRYGLYAMEKVINDLLFMGCKKHELVAKVFGGANITGAINHGNIGRKNSEFVLAFLQNDGIRVVAADLNGTHTRRIKFHTATGEVRVEKVVQADMKVVKQENDYRSKLIAEPLKGSVTFF